MTKRRKVTDADLDQAAKDITQIRSTLEAEAQMLLESYNPRLVAYACLTTAIKAAIKGGISPADFAKLSADTIGLWCGDKPDAGGLSVIVIDTPDE
jgi:hypothetical protein